MQDILTRNLRRAATAATMALWVAVAPASAAIEPRGPAGLDAIITVNTSADEDTANAACSLREAIIAANTNAAYRGCPAGSAVTTDTIGFTAAVVQINLQSELPEVVNRLNIDGYTPAANRVRLNGAALAAGADALQVGADGVAISNLQIFNLAPGGGRAIYVREGENTRVFFNLIGLTESSTSCATGGVTRASAYGVALGSASSGAVVFGNVIGCNATAGVLVNGSDSHDIGVSGVTNEIGAYLDHAVPNGIGVWLNNAGADGAKNNTVKNNRIAGNTGDGVRISGTGSNDATSSASNAVVGNRIGLKSNGKDPLPNGDNGVRIADGAYLNRVGGDTAAERNVISGNQDSGVRIEDSNANGVLGNYIGLTITGTEKAGNLGAGVLIVNGERNGVGCTLLCGQREGNRIGGNLRGVEVVGGSLNVIASNSVGVAPGGLFGLNIGNVNTGILIRDGATRTSVGSGANAAWANTIAFNGTMGVRVQGTTTLSTSVGINTIYFNARQGIGFLDGTRANVVKGATVLSNGSSPLGAFDGIYQELGTSGNRWSEVSLASNAGLGIDVLAASEMANVVTDPEVTFTEVTKAGPNILIKGSVANTTFIGVREVEVYEVALDASGYGEGFTFVGRDTVAANGAFELLIAGANVKCYTAFVTYYPSLTGADYSTEFSRSSCAQHLPLVVR